MNYFKEQLENCIHETVESYLEDFRKNDQERKKLQKEILGLSTKKDEILKDLPTKEREILSAYLDRISDMHFSDCRFLFKMGLKDGQKLREEFY